MQSMILGCGEVAAGWGKGGEDTEVGLLEAPASAGKVLEGPPSVEIIRTTIPMRDAEFFP